MTWIYVPLSLSSAAERGSISESDSLFQMFAQSVTSKGKVSPPLFWRRAWKKEAWTRRLSGLTSPVLTVVRGADAWISSQADSRARISPLPDAERGSQVSAPACGETTRASSTKYNLDLSSLKTSARSARAGSMKSCPTLPRSGSMRNGIVSERPTQTRPIDESVSSFWPTPTAAQYGSSQNGINGKGGEFERPSAGTLSLFSLARQGKLPRGPRDRAETGTDSCDCARSLSPLFVEALMGWPEGWTSTRIGSACAVTAWFHKWRLWLSSRS